MRISDWSSDVCSSDLHMVEARRRIDGGHFRDEDGGEGPHAVRQYGQGERADHEGDPPPPAGEADIADQQAIGGHGDHELRAGTGLRHPEINIGRGDEYALHRSEERRGGKGWGSTWRS